MKKILAALLAAEPVSGCFCRMQRRQRYEQYAIRRHRRWWWDGTTDYSQQEAYTVKLMMPGDAKTEDRQEQIRSRQQDSGGKIQHHPGHCACGLWQLPGPGEPDVLVREKLDLLYNNRDIFVSAVNNGQIVEMTPYLEEYGKDLLEQIPQERWDCTSIDGKVYAVPANKEIAVSWGFACVKEMADATGVDYSNIKTEEDLLPLLRAAKEMYPDVWPVVASYGGMSTMNTNDDLGADIGSLERLHRQQQYHRRKLVCHRCVP